MSKSNTARREFTPPALIIIVIVFERQTPEHGLVPEPRAQPVDRAFRLGGAVIEQVGEIGLVGVA